MNRLGEEVCWYANAMYCPFEVYQKNTFSTRVINTLYQGYLSRRLPFSVLDPLGSISFWEATQSILWEVHIYPLGKTHSIRILWEKTLFSRKWYI